MPGAPGPAIRRGPSLTFVLWFWLPLAATWLMMSVEGPYVAAIIARMPEAAFNLAAYGVAFSLAWLVESPIMMLLTAANSLVSDRPSFLALRRFTYRLNAIVTAVMVVGITAAGLPVRHRHADGAAARGGFARARRHGDPRAVAGGHRVPALLPGHPRPPRPGPTRGVRDRAEAGVDVGHGRGPRPGQPAARREHRRHRPRHRRAGRGGGQPPDGAPRGRVAASRARRRRDGADAARHLPLLLPARPDVDHLARHRAAAHLLHGPEPCSRSNRSPCCRSCSRSCSCSAAAAWRSRRSAWRCSGRGQEHKREIARALRILASGATIALAVMLFTPLADVWFRRVSGLPHESVAVRPRCPPGCWCCCPRWNTGCRTNGPGSSSAARRA